MTNITGLYVANLNHDVRHKFHIPDDVNEGAVIVKKEEQSKFRKLHVGDVVLSIINKGHTHKIASSLVFRNTLVNILQEKKPAIAFKVLRKGMTIYVEGKLDDDK